MAAGMGSRYGGLKQLDAVGPKGETILDYSIYDAKRAGFNKVVFVIREFFKEEFQEKIVSRYEGEIEVQTVFQELNDLPAGFSIPEGREKPWGTGHALWSARQAISEPFVVINADDYYGVSAFRTASRQLDAMSRDQLEISMVAYELENTLSENGSVSRGVCEVKNGQLVNIVETHEIQRKGDGIVGGEAAEELPSEALVSMNLWLFNEKVFESTADLWTSFLAKRGHELKSEFYIIDIASKFIADGGNLAVLRSDSKWVGVTYREDKPKVEAFLQERHKKGIYPEGLIGGQPDVHLESVLDQFQVCGDLSHAIPYGSGHINSTYAVTVSQGGSSMRYLLQRINTEVFKRPDQLMDNISRVLEHAQAKLKASGDLEATRRAMTLIPAKSGQPFVLDADGHPWRCYIFVEGATGHDIIQTPEQATEAARAFGQFQDLMSDLPGAPLHETIVDFHNTPDRYQKFEDALERDTMGRAKNVQAEIDFFKSRKGMAHHLLNLVEEGKIPVRVTHNDTKLNNVLLDDKSQEGICVIDLDTTMPGLALYDFGDLVRTSTSPAAEDEVDTSKVVCQPHMFEALVKGYLSTAKSFLNEHELANLVFAGKLITYEVGLRFLTDYLDGDNYFKVKRDGHNLDRCRTQMALVASIEEQEGALESIVKSFLSQ
jgi:NDP-sugar pyrophosphorylase family protein/Ser/Thr protein kinase RdoA (MazF antagonist)